MPGRTGPNGMVGGGERGAEAGTAVVQVEAGRGRDAEATGDQGGDRRAAIDRRTGGDDEEADLLEGLTIGRLATELELSKAGLLGHFGTKQALQLAVIETAAEMFVREVPQRVRGVSPGLPYLSAVCEAWVSYLERRILPGGCFFTATAAEFDGRGGPVRDAIARLHTRWQDELGGHIRQAVDAGELPSETDGGQLVYDLLGTMLALNHFLQLHHDGDAPTRARRALHRLLDS